MTGSLTLNGMVFWLAVIYCCVFIWASSSEKDPIGSALNAIYLNPLLVLPFVFVVVQLVLSAKKLLMPKWVSLLAVFFILGKFANVVNSVNQKSGFVPSSNNERQHFSEAVATSSPSLDEGQHQRDAQAQYLRQEAEKERVASEAFKKSLNGFSPIAEGLMYGPCRVSDDFGNSGFTLAGEIANCSLKDLAFSSFRLNLFDKEGNRVLQKDFVVASLPKRERTPFEVLVEIKSTRVPKFSITLVHE
jgi:hypothetical protein